MKFNITLSDMTESEYLDVVSKLKGTAAPVAVEETVAVEAPQGFARGGEALADVPQAPAAVEQAVTPIAPITPAPTIELPPMAIPGANLPALPEHFTEQEVAAPAEPVQVVSEMTLPEAPNMEVETDYDLNGVPWDGRINSSPPKKTKKFYWQRKRNVEDAYFDSVMEELKAAASGEEPLPAFAQKAAAAAAQVATPAPTAPVDRDFNGFTKQLQDLFKTGAVDPSYPPTIVERINKDFGVKLATITDIHHTAEMVKYAWDCLEVDGHLAAKVA